MSTFFVDLVSALIKAVYLIYGVVYFNVMRYFTSAGHSTLDLRLPDFKLCLVHLLFIIYKDTQVISRIRS